MDKGYLYLCRNTNGMKQLCILAIEEQSNLSTVACMAGAYELFTEANSYWKRSHKEARFRVQLVGPATGQQGGNELFALKPHTAIKDIRKTDLVIVPSSLIRSYDTATANNRALINWVGQQYRRGAEVASMCTGAFFLAAAGLLDGRTCSTHWAASEKFMSLFPEVNLQTDKLITDENGIYTNGGAYSFLHLLLYLIEKHYDRETAIYCAKIFQVDPDRNLQAGFAIFNGHKKHSDAEILEAQAYIEQHYTDKISMETLAARYGIGRRNFDRRFIKATGITPLDYLQRVKVEAAKRSFEGSRKTVNEVMYDVGYNDTKAFREVFGRVTGMSPVDYKAKYNKER